MSLFERVSEEKGKRLPRLTNASMTGMIPLFVRGGGDHKCGGCSLFSRPGGCTIVGGQISGPNGSCSYWTKAAAPDTPPPMKMTKVEAGYVEVPSGKKIACGTCRFFSDGACKLWQGRVAAADCCMAWAG